MDSRCAASVAPTHQRVRTAAGRAEADCRWRPGESAGLRLVGPAATDVGGNTSSITDQFGRTFTYLRIAVTDVCNLRCVYCMPEHGVNFLNRRDRLKAEEILRISRVAAGLGVHKIRFTGGEPLARGDIVELVEETARTSGIRSVHLTTNGVLLARFAAALRSAGLHGLNVSLDTLDPARFSRCARRKGLARVLAGLRRAVALDFPSLKVNVVAMRGFNDDEVGRFVDLTRDTAITVRFVELMPFDADQIWKTGRFLSAERMVDRFKALYPASEPADGSATEWHVFRVRGYSGKVAFIPSYSRSHCNACTRIRITADGKIRNCLYSEGEYDLVSALRNGGTDADIAEVLKTAMWEKLVDGRAAQRQAREGETGAGRQRSSMAQIGG